MKTNKPKIKVKLENETFKVLEIQGNSGDILSSHKVDHDAVLQILTGCVIYKEGSTHNTLIDEATQSIPNQQLHELEFRQESKLLLFLYKGSKIQFSNK